MFQRLSAARERDYISADPMYAKLVEASNEAWGTPLYGLNAADIIKTMRDNTFGAINADHTGTHFLRISLGDRVSRTHSLGDTKYQIRHNTEAVIAAANLPYNVIFDEPGNNRSGALLLLQVGQMNTELLGNFVRARKYDNHNLEGTIGKALDTLVYASGLIPEGIDPSQAESDEEFIPLKALYELARMRRLGQETIYNIKYKVDNALCHQLNTGQPTNEGEIVFEGELRANTATARLYSPEFISIDSLARLANSYGNQKRPSVAFLRKATNLITYTLDSGSSPE